MKQWLRGKGDAVGARVPSNFSNPADIVQGKTCRSAHCCCVHPCRQANPLPWGDKAAGLGLLLQPCSSMLRADGEEQQPGLSVRVLIAFAVVQRWPWPWALQELAALHVIQFLTCHSPSVAPGMAQPQQ